MNIAYLISAFHQPLHLSRLIRALSCDGAYFFIHIDRKSNFSEFKNAIKGNDNIVFLRGRHRIKISWAGFSQVQGTLNLLRFALRYHVSFNRFCQLSGSDFPIKSNDEIRRQFETEKEFLRVDRRITALDHNSHCKTVRYFWFQDGPLFLKNRLSGKIPRRTYKKINLYHGADWYALTAGCVKYIMEFLRKHRDYVRFHKYTFCPSEVFFHSIVKQSPYAPKIVHDFEVVECIEDFFSLNEHGCHYIDWNAKGVPLPKVLDTGDMDVLMKSKALFARKFEKEQSTDLLLLIEKRLSNTSSTN